MSSVKVRVALACQGGGSQTAFTAGVLKALCGNKNKLRDHFNVVSLSGTSGGHCLFHLVRLQKRRRVPLEAID
jgi:NTE family protein